MPIIEQFDCPYCQTKSSGFQAVGAYSRSSNHLRREYVTYLHEDWFLLSCGKCKKCITASYNYSHRSDRDLQSTLTKHGDLKEKHYTYIDHMPKVTSVGEPSYVPERVLVPFRQAISNIAASNWDAAGTMARKTLEVATKDIVREKASDEAQQEHLIKKTWLKARIRILHEMGHLTQGLSDLANLIKDEGDDATHDEVPYGETEARELVGYAQVLLTYVYTIPGMVAQVRSRADVAS